MAACRQSVIMSPAEWLTRDRDQGSYIEDGSSLIQQGRSDGGGYRYLYLPPKSAQVNFLWGKMTAERLFNSFIHPQKLLYPPKQISGYAPVYDIKILYPTRNPSLYLCLLYYLRWHGALKLYGYDQPNDSIGL